MEEREQLSIFRWVTVKVDQSSQVINWNLKSGNTISSYPIGA